MNFDHQPHIELVNAVFKIVDASYSIYSTRNINLASAEGPESSKIECWKNELMKKLSSDLKFSLRLDSKFVPTVKGRIKRFNVFAVENFCDFFQIYEKITPNLFKYNGFYLIVLVNGKIPEIQQIIDSMWKKQIFNVNVIFEDKTGIIQVQTFMPFNVNKCNDTIPITINTYANGRFENDLKDVFPRKLKNLHNCPIRVSTSNGSQPHVFVENFTNGSLKLSGENIEIIKTLSNLLNFKLDFSFIGVEGYLFENGTAEGPLKALFDGNADLSINNWWMKIDRLKFFDCSMPYVSEKIVMLVPPGRELTTFEKLTYPFTTTSWIFILVCLISGILVIVIIKRQPMVIQNFVFGTGVRSPISNLFAAFIGQNQSRLPRRNFARFLLMLFERSIKDHSFIF
jgi:hypothetical protein